MVRVFHHFPLALHPRFSYPRRSLDDEGALMTRFRLYALLLTCLACAYSASGASVARADDPEPEVSDQEEVDPQVDIMHHRWDRLVGIELTGGVENTPYGIIGGDVILQPHRLFRIDAGFGGSRDGIRVGGGVSLVMPQDHFALTIRLGLAGGPLTWTSDRAPTSTRAWNFAPFFNGEVGLEYRFDEGVLVRFFAGVETTLVGRADSCIAAPADAQGLGGVCAPDNAQAPARVFLGLSVGYMFDVIL